MKDFVRLAAGILLLGVAIYLSMNVSDKGAAENEDAHASETGLSPDWQSPPVDGHTITQSEPDIVRPDFQDRSEVAATSVSSSPDVGNQLSLPPRISDQYRPMQPIMVTGQVQRETMLVPVQPKPSFTGSLSPVRQIHTIRDGDSLQSIASEYFGSADRYLEIYLLNKDVLANPSRLPEGVEIRIPGD